MECPDVPGAKCWLGTGRRMGRPFLTWPRTVHGPMHLVCTEENGQATRNQTKPRQCRTGQSIFFLSSFISLYCCTFNVQLHRVKVFKG